MTSALIHCQPYGGRGMLSHYYHFFFACFIPLVDFNFHTSPSRPCFMITDLAIQLGPFRNFITPDLCTVLPAHTMASAHLEWVILPSYDIYDNILFSNTSIPRLNPEVTQPHVFQYFNTLLKTTARHFPPTPQHKQTKKIILVIERSVELYYHPNSTESSMGITTNPVKYTSGSTRRRIKNHEALIKALRLKYEGNINNDSNNEYTILTTSLEGINLMDQYTLFHSANLVIAQHGAALSNIIFMQKNSSHVVEISPPFSRQARYFRNLATHLNVSYSSVFQVCLRFRFRIHLPPIPEYPSPSITYYSLHTSVD